jgi:hypothetical protein
MGYFFGAGGRSPDYSYLDPEDLIKYRTRHEQQPHSGMHPAAAVVILVAVLGLIVLLESSQQSHCKEGDVRAASMSRALKNSDCISESAIEVCMRKAPNTPWRWHIRCDTTKGDVGKIYDLWY